MSCVGLVPTLASPTPNMEEFISTVGDDSLAEGSKILAAWVAQRGFDRRADHRPVSRRCAVAWLPRLAMHAFSRSGFTHRLAVG
mmetsp:Transcript_107071/g.299723  ORF Transcript_107071/g.299723 Transcript_107071/m.299723 type:complete len:84 (+) Transcript_107071:96-347(+)